MPAVESSALIDAPIERAYELSQDYRIRLQWDPFLRSFRFLDETDGPQIGGRIWVKAENGLTMTVEYVSIRPPERVAVKMIDGPWIFERFAGAWTFTEVGERTRVLFRYNFKLRSRILRRVLEPIALAVFRRDIEARLRGFDRYVKRTRRDER